MKIVKTTTRHLKALVNVGKTNWNEKWLTSKYLHETWKKKGYHFTALENGKPVGSIMVVEVDYPKFWIFYFAVDQEYHRKGIGSALLKKAESKIKKGLFLFVDLEGRDKKGLSFYKKNGFKITGKVSNWFERSGKGIILAKKIR